MKKILLLLLLLLLLSCATNKAVLRWNATIIENNSAKPYYYWSDGMQYLALEQDGIELILSGMRYNYDVYLLVSIINRTEKIIQLYPARSRAKQIQKNEVIDINSKLPRDFRKESISSATGLAVLYGISTGLNAVASSRATTYESKTYYDNRANQNLNDHNALQWKLRQRTSNILDVMLKNHTLYPNEQYSGFLIFDDDITAFSLKYPVNFEIDIAGTIFEVQGRLLNHLEYDEFDLPENIQKINFSK